MVKWTLTPGHPTVPKDFPLFLNDLAGRQLLTPGIAPAPKRAGRLR